MWHRVRGLSGFGWDDGSGIAKSSSLSEAAVLDGRSWSSRHGRVQICENVCESEITFGSCPHDLPRRPLLKPISCKWSRYFWCCDGVSCNLSTNSVFTGNFVSSMSTDFLEIRGWSNLLRTALFVCMICTSAGVAVSFEPFKMGLMKL